MRQAYVAGVLVGSVLLAAGCSGSSPAPLPSPGSSTPAAPASAPIPTQGSLGPTGLPNAETGETEAGVAPSWDAESRSQAVVTAQKALELFARPDITQARWFDELTPYLTETAARDYAYLDPAAITAHAVTGPGKLVKGTSPYLAEVTAPTDAGRYRVLLSRHDGASPWRVARFIPPEES